MKTDANDILREEGPNGLRQIFDKTLDAPVAANGVAKGPRFELTPFDKIKPHIGSTYLIKGLLPRTGLFVFWGAPKCGKSFLAFDMVMHVALGWDYRGRRVNRGPVVYAALEGSEGFRGRVEAFRRRKLSGESESPPFYLMTTPLSLVRDQFAFVASIRAQLGDAVPVAVVIDTLNRSLAGSESDDRDMAAYVRASDAIRDAFECAIIVIHHCGHKGDRPRGHSCLIGALDVQIAVRRDAADNVIAELELAKDGPIGDVLVSRLVPVEIGHDEDRDPITSCIVEAVEGKPAKSANAAGQKLTKGARISLDALHRAIGDLGRSAPTSSHVPSDAKIVSLKQWREYAYRLGIASSEGPRARQLAFQRAYETLLTAKKVGVWDDQAWVVQ